MRDPEPHVFLFFFARLNFIYILSFYVRFRNVYVLIKSHKANLECTYIYFIREINEKLITFPKDSGMLYKGSWAEYEYNFLTLNKTQGYTMPSFFFLLWGLSPTSKTKSQHVLPTKQNQDFFIPLAVLLWVVVTGHVLLFTVGNIQA